MGFWLWVLCDSEFWVLWCETCVWHLFVALLFVDFVFVFSLGGYWCLLMIWFGGMVFFDALALCFCAFWFFSGIGWV